MNENNNQMTKDKGRFVINEKIITIQIKGIMLQIVNESSIKESERKLSQDWFIILLTSCKILALDLWNKESKRCKLWTLRRGFTYDFIS